jgi:cellulase/cellobiase CelA1
VLHFPLAAATAAVALLTPATAAEYACQVKYEFASTWSTGFTATIDITNVGTGTLFGWTLKFALPAGQSFANGWNAGWRPTPDGLEADAKDYNAVVEPKVTKRLGFEGSGTAPFTKPTAFSVNTITCS